MPSPSVLLHFVKDYALASFVIAVQKTKKYATKYSVLVLPDKSAFSLIFSFQHFEAFTKKFQRSSAGYRLLKISKIVLAYPKNNKRKEKENSLQSMTENHTPNSIFDYGQCIFVCHIQVTAYMIHLFLYSFNLSFFLEVLFS